VLYQESQSDLSQSALSSGSPPLGDLYAPDLGILNRIPHGPGFCILGASSLCALTDTAERRSPDDSRYFGVAVDLLPRNL